MVNKAHPTSVPAKSKTADNRSRLSKTTAKPQRSPAMIDKLIELGVPAALAKDFPLTPHPSGRWCKKVLGKVWFFGKLGDGWQDAQQRFDEDKKAIYSGRKPQRLQKGGLTLLDLCNRFMDFKRQHVNEERLTLRSWYDYHEMCKRLMKVLGEDRSVNDLGPDDFAKLAADYAAAWGPVRRKNENNRVRILFNWAFEAELIEKPMRFGPAFVPPDRKELRKMKARTKAKHGARMFEAVELRRILDAAPQPLKAMILLGINGGMGNHDVATLPLSALDLEKGWIDFPRPKTGVERRIPLWPETMSAIKEWLAARPEAKRPEDTDVVFLTKQRRAWFRLGRFVESEGGSAQVKGIDNPVAKSLRVLLDGLGVNGGRNFYALRHGFETIAGDTGDQVAVDAIMGHADNSMAGVYRERIDPERLRRVVEHVRQWLYGPTK
jgi:integrase